MTVFVMSSPKFLAFIKKKYLHVKNIYDIICYNNDAVFQSDYLMPKMFKALKGHIVEVSCVGLRCPNVD